jgi:cytochrome o ubiquinol oxidase operon protein cyoD
MEKSAIYSYVTGFVLSLILTLATYWVVVKHLLTATSGAALIGALALAQTAVQLLFFLRMADERKPHWKLTVFLFMLLVVVVIVFGSLWIMYSLNYNLMMMHDH